MSIASKISDVVDMVARRFLLTAEELEELRSELETDLQDARNGEFIDSPSVVADCEMRIIKVNQELARRQVAR